MKRRRHLTGLRVQVAGLLACLLTCLCATHALAAFPVRILVVQGSGVPSPIRNDAIAALVGVGDLADDANYLAGASEQGLAPASDQALRELGRSEYATIMVVLESVRHANTLHITYRDGRTAEPVLQQDVAYRGRHLSEQARAEIAQATEQAITQIRGTSTAAAPQVSSGRFGRPAQPMQPTRPSVEPPAMEEPPPSTAELPPPAEPSTGTSSDLPPPMSDEDTSAGKVSADFSAGFGVGNRTVTMPSSGGDRQLSTQLFPAFDIALGAEADIGEPFVFGGRARYQSSLGLVGEETAPASSGKITALRSHHLEFGVTPGVRFAHSSESVVLVLFAGWGVRGLRSVVDLSIPGYTMHGPVLRPELRIPLASGRVVLRFAPELLAVIAMTGGITAAADISGSGVALGGEVSVRVSATDWLAIDACYRESHATLATLWPTNFVDIERFATVRAVLQY